MAQADTILVLHEFNRDLGLDEPEASATGSGDIDRRHALITTCAAGGTGSAFMMECV